MDFEGALLYLNLFIRGAFRVQYRAGPTTNSSSSLNYAQNHIT
jgi:hypothetical protein